MWVGEVFTCGVGSGRMVDPPVGFLDFLWGKGWNFWEGLGDRVVLENRE